jgi:hypothetical protein
MISNNLIVTLLQRMERFGATVANKFTIVRDRLNTLQTRVQAVEQMSPTQIGLGSVLNYPPATQRQAKGAVNSNSVMTPKRTDDWARTNVYGPIGQAFKDSAARL